MIEGRPIMIINLGGFIDCSARQWPVGQSQVSRLSLHEEDQLKWAQLILYSAKFLRAVNFMDFAVSLQNTKIISAKMNRQLVIWLN